MPLLRPYKPRQRFSPAKIKHEESLQRQICRYLKLQYPSIIFRSDYASGLQLTMNQAAVHKSLQSSRSWPDLFIYKHAERILKDGSKRHYCGLALELKKEGTVIYLKRGSRKGLLTADAHIQEQAMMLRELNNLGYFARFGVGFDQCQRIIDWYLNPDYREQENGELF
jgi:hypothetical protein